LLIPKDDPGLAVLKELAANAVTEKWGTKPPANLRSPFRDGDVEKEDYEDYRGMVFMNIKSNQRPGVVDENVDPIIDPSELLAGDWVRCTVNAFAYSQKGNSGVSFGLRNVQRMAKGEAMKGGVSRAEDDFGQVTDEEGATAPMSKEAASKLAETLF
jgi:hypothetical protein